MFGVGYTGSVCDRQGMCGGVEEDRVCVVYLCVLRVGVARYLCEYGVVVCDQEDVCVWRGGGGGEPGACVCVCMCVCEGMY